MKDVAREFDLLENLCEAGDETLAAVASALGGPDRAREILWAFLVHGLVRLRFESSECSLDLAAAVLVDEAVWAPDYGVWCAITQEGSELWRSGGRERLKGIVLSTGAGLRTRFRSAAGSVIRASLREFARTGKLGEIVVGITSAEVIAVAGQPTGWNSGVPEPMAAAAQLGRGVWSYGSIELFWYDSKLVMIYWENCDDPMDGGTIDLDPWFVKPGVKIEDVEIALRQAAIPYQRGYYPSLEQVYFRTGAGVDLVCARADFDDKSLPFQLCSISGTTERPHPDIVWDAAR